MFADCKLADCGGCGIWSDVVAVTACEVLGGLYEVKGVSLTCVVLVLRGVTFITIVAVAPLIFAGFPHAITNIAYFDSDGRFTSKSALVTLQLANMQEPPPSPLEYEVNSVGERCRPHGMYIKF